DATTQGRVKSIRWRHTVVETRNWDTIIVPNVTLLSSNIVILGKRADAPRQRRYWIFFNVDFRHAPADVIEVVTQALHAAPIPNVAADPKPSVVCMDFARDGRDSFAYYGARYWLTDLAVDDPTNSAVRERIYAALQRAGIPLAMPATAVFVSNDDEEHQVLKSRREHDRRVDLLGRLALFKDFNEAERSQLASDLIYAPFARYEVITHQGREAHWLYILARGEADVILADDDGSTGKVGTIRGPDFFGEMGVLTGEPRTASVVAASPCECYRLEKAAFQRILGERHELAEMVTSVLVQRRQGLRAVQQGLDADQSKRQLESARREMLGKIQTFFGLS
ncbi:MAG: cyclic nucleotide-binding domain-containing protein, partial [Deltaproteobacteria bacterium]